MEHDLYIQLLSINEKLDYLVNEMEKAKEKVKKKDKKE